MNEEPMKRKALRIMPAAAAADAPAGPKIVILATGGTIAETQADPMKAGCKTGALRVEDLIRAVPRIRGRADLTVEQFSNIASRNMDGRMWLRLAGRVNKLLRRGDVGGMVITHGTDTMEETAWFLNLVVKSGKPVVMTGAMRPATAVGADGPANLLNAVAVAAHPDAGGRGVLVTLNDEIHFAREIEKRDSTQPDAFKSPNRGLAGAARAGAVRFFGRPATPHTGASEFSVEGARSLPRVEIVYSHANMGRDFIDCAVEKGAAGIVLAGVGAGNVSDRALAALSDAIRKGVAVVRSSRTGGGIVMRNSEMDDEKTGTIAAMEFNPQKARVLLMLALMKTSDPKAIQEAFLKY